MTCSACIGAVGSVIFDYETLGLSGEALANILTPLCNIALDKDVCRGAIDNYLVSKQFSNYLPRYLIPMKRTFVPNFCSNDELSSNLS